MIPNSGRVGVGNNVEYRVIKTGWISRQMLHCRVEMHIEASHETQW